MNEIVWRRAFGHSDSRRYGIIHDAILYYSKAEDCVWHELRQPAGKDYIDTSLISLTRSEVNDTNV